ncbi:MAG: hypothetical protein P1U41_08685 [Vicingaceae bacterium]|nr:hypothetical protein [Vicingaceae bacterium]
MKLFRSILALTLVVAFLNVIAGKAIHEIFEHDHHEHTCDVKDKIHFHAFEYAHADFICDYNFSTTFLQDYKVSTDSIIRYFEQQIKVKYLWLVQNIFLNNLSLRGPPNIK